MFHLLQQQKNNNTLYSVVNPVGDFLQLDFLCSSLFLNLLEIGRRLNINMDFYAQKVDKITGKI
jgi:hypothetical protein